MIESTIPIIVLQESTTNFPILSYFMRACCHGHECPISILHTAYMYYVMPFVTIAGRWMTEQRQFCPVKQTCGAVL